MADLNQVRQGLLEIDIAVHTSWKLGKNMVVGWIPDESGIQVCLAPCYRVLGQATTSPRLLDGRRTMAPAAFAEACKLLQVRPLRIAVPFKIGSDKSKGEIDPEVIDNLIRRYSIVQTPYRAVMLFDIVGFSKVSMIEQVAQLNSLEYSINNAARKLNEAGLDVELARSTVGDGFYVWNRARGLEADLRTYAALLLILIDNRLAQIQAGPDSRLVPKLRACFCVGSHYSYHQVEGTKPRGFEYIVGEVTISLARLIGKALPGQIVVGVFQRPLDPLTQMIDSVMFLARAEKVLARLNGAVIGEHGIKEIRSAITGGKVPGRLTAVPAIKYQIADKHGYQHELFNVRAAVQREDAPVLEFGLGAGELAGFGATPTVYDLPNLKSDGPRVVQSAS